MRQTTGISSMLKQSLYVFFCALLFVACDKTPNGVSEEPSITDTTAQGIFICNEGNFQWGNASLSLYNSATGSVQEDVYKAANGKGVGDVLQSMLVHQDLAYLLVNNSRKIEVIDAKTCKSLYTITGFNSPRYMLPVSSDKAYVSDLYENAVYILDLKSRQITGKIGCKSWTEQMVMLNKKVYVCGTTSKYVYVINTENDQLIDSIELGYGAQYIVKDNQEKMWVLTNGKSPIVPQLFCINAAGGIEKLYSFASTDLPSRLLISPSLNCLYWINKGIYRMDISATALPTAPLVEAGVRNFYGLGYDPYNKQLLVSDAKDFVQKSEVYRFDTLGNLKGNFKTQINSGYFYAR
jgi:DNA-binding beta-propeller fold protein YncE